MTQKLALLIRMTNFRARVSFIHHKSSYSIAYLGDDCWRRGRLLAVPPLAKDVPQIFFRCGKRWLLCEVAQHTNGQTYLLDIICATFTICKVCFKLRALLWQERVFEIIGDEFHDFLTGESSRSCPGGRILFRCGTREKLFKPSIHALPLQTFSCPSKYRSSARRTLERAR